MRGSYGRLRRSPYPDHLIHCERGTHRIARHDEQVRLLVGDLSKAARHPVLEPRPLGRHRERPDICAISSHGGSDLFDITLCHPLTPARIRDSVQNPLNILKAAWSAKFARYASVLEAYGPKVHLIPVPISTSVAFALLSRNGFSCLFNCVESTILLKCRSKHFVSTTRRLAR